jgi:hypothetical protein
MTSRDYFSLAASAAAILSMCVPFSAYAVDSFNPVSNLLSIDQIFVSGLGPYSMDGSPQSLSKYILEYLGSQIPAGSL